MKLHLLLTQELIQTKPDSSKIIQDFGDLVVRFGDEETYKGLHCFVEDEIQNLINWLKPFDKVIIGNGNPMSETFTIEHIV